MCAEAFNPDDDEEDSEPRVVHPKTDEQRCRLQEACKDILLFKALDQVRTLTHRYEGYKTVNRCHPGCITPVLRAGQSVRFGLHVWLNTRALLTLPLSFHHVRGTYCLFNVLLLVLICIVYFLLMSCSMSKLRSGQWIKNVLWRIWRLTRACNRVSKMGIFALLWICNTCR